MAVPFTFICRRSLVEGKQRYRLPTFVEISDKFTLFARAMIRPRLAQGESRLA
jgi:hypothetical protein